ncbi:hypothetical protein FOQG_05902 [Fusarium oxysporum f. sp. raphani 54005]|uniref:Uncharacterized protein n=5 Tax=Fusarium oxysporum TaxID=5507 RepID=X0CM45_FUSOX|nr:hypothetical protein FOXG_20348 [Fusarium oxysporum f. sp. lycopersici 4287]EWZ81314.1 hypothetical protein FOWG_14869 [Fusarium oxysporum f. sp. lycopersici MN25]EXA46189.1 hypothetical protein FOVG_06937 [Fusarium oxysporum f. sp. pisi HDV247]EXK40699.1 hypothetical protein FOMG_07460 [Fusarium oxysporum f. sp. melonis 26406]EXK91899.1 hypothetical protein FOQG_05902 [Fusarium oxysporum f. sp. raphani 54005]EXM22094.1 hypothetical protein FOTG_10072 [Fusarium oxysporum f. sp. vasinfectum 
MVPLIVGGHTVRCQQRPTSDSNAHQDYWDEEKFKLLSED